MNYADLPVSDAALARIAECVLDRGVPFTRTGLKSVIDETSYRGLEEAMLRAGLLRQVRDDDPERVDLTAAGRAILRHYLPRSVSKSSEPAQAGELGEQELTASSSMEARAAERCSNRRTAGTYSSPCLPLPACGGCAI
jgi:hypothetical protein